MKKKFTRINDMIDPLVYALLFVPLLFFMFIISHLFPFYKTSLQYFCLQSQVFRKNLLQ